MPHTQFAVLRLALLLLLSALPQRGSCEPLTPGQVAARLQRHFNEIRDYQCVIHSETRAGGRVEAMTFRLWYRAPGLLRLRVLHGRHAGSELLVDAAGVLRGRRGGLLHPFSRRLDRSDPSLRSLRGQPAWELDFGSFLKAMHERMALPGSKSRLLSSSPAGMPGAGQPLRLEVRYRQAGSARPLRDVWTIDPARWLLESGDVFDGDTRVDHVELSEVRLNTGLKQSWFHF